MFYADACETIGLFLAVFIPDALAKSISWLYRIKLALGVLFEFYFSP